MAKTTKIDVGRRMLSYYADSADIDKLSPRAENLFTRLLPLLDDFGNHQADPAWLRLRCFPRKHNWKNQAVRNLRDELVEHKIAVLYGDDGYECPEGKYLHYVKFDDHQKLIDERKRAEVPRYIGQKPVSAKSTYDRALCPPDLLRSEGSELMQVAEESTKMAPKLSTRQVKDKQESTSVFSVQEETHTPPPVPVEHESISVPDESHPPSPVQSELEPAPASAASSAPAPSNIRDWSQNMFGVPASRLRACIVYQLDHVKNDWFIKNLSVSALQRENFVRKLDADTPSEWAPPKKRPTTEQGFYRQVPDPTCTRCNNGKIYEDGLDRLCPCNRKQWVTERAFYGIA